MMRELVKWLCLCVPAISACVGDAPEETEFDVLAAGPSTRLVARGATWMYLDNGSDQGTSWRAGQFDDASWKSGAAQLGYGDGDEATVVSYGSRSSNKFITTYFRHSFSVTDPAQVTSLVLGVMRDDGAIVYLNGVEVARSNMPSGTASYTTRATKCISSGESTLHGFTVPAARLVAGTNVLAVEIHQCDRTSSDVSFDLELVAAMAEATDATAPGNVATLTLSGATASSVVAAWQAPGDDGNTGTATAYDMRYATSPITDASWAAATPVSGEPAPAAAGSTQAMTISGLAAAKTYYVALKARDEAGNESGLSNVAMATTASSSTPPPTTSGTVYYVATTGSDTNSGSSASPFRTIQKAASIVNPGDLVIVRSGVYTGGTGAVVSVNRAGTADKWITIRSEVQWGAKLDGRSNATAQGFVFSSGAKYVRVEGFELYGFNNEGMGVHTGGGTDLQLVGNHIHHIGRHCTDDSGGLDGIFVKSTRIHVEGNVIHDIGRLAPGELGCNPTTGYYQNHDHGLYISGSSDVRVINNIFYNIQRGWPIHVYSSSIASTRLHIANNTFAGENPYRDGQLLFSDAPVSDTIVENNIFYDPRVAGIRLASDVTLTNVVVRNNMTYDGTITTGSYFGTITFGTNWNNTNPLFVDAANRDYYLMSTSPAIDIGLTVSEVPRDFDQTARPQGAGYDLGAHEYVP